MKKLYDDNELQCCYKRGFECGLNGANILNPNYTFFSTEERRDAWERGYRNGRKARGVFKEEKQCQEK